MSPLVPDPAEVNHARSPSGSRLSSATSNCESRFRICPNWRARSGPAFSARPAAACEDPGISRRARNRASDLLRETRTQSFAAIRDSADHSTRRPRAAAHPQAALPTAKRTGRIFPIRECRPPPSKLNRMRERCFRRRMGYKMHFACHIRRDFSPLQVRIAARAARRGRIPSLIFWQLGVWHFSST